MVPKDSLWYWNKFAKASSIYHSLGKTLPTNYEKKIQLLEIMNGSLLGFIEENFKDPDPVPAASIIHHIEREDNGESEGKAAA